MNLTEYPDRDLMFMALADRITSDLKGHIARHGSATLAVPGGTTPGPIFDVLAAARLDWANVTVLPTDERWVPETSDRSNARLIRERLLTGSAAAARFVPLYMPGDAPEDRLDEIAAAVSDALPITVLVLGMGDDMHTASLFPGAEGLAQALAADAPPAAAMRPGGQPEPRVTLTAPALKTALSTHVLITGPDKRAALDRARKLNDPAQAPICAVLRDAAVHWAE